MLQANRAFCSVAVTFALFVAASDAVAGQPPTINAQSFELAAGLNDGLIAASAARQDTGDWQRSWNLVSALHYSRRPLAFVNRAGPAPLTQTILGDVWMTDLGASVGWQTWTFAAVLPVALLIRGGGPDLVQVGDARSPSFGDLRLSGRRWLLGRSVAGFGRIDVAALVGYAAPTAAQGSWLGGSGTQLDLGALASWSLGLWRAHVNLGVRLRGRSALIVQDVDPETGDGKVDAAGAAQTSEVLATGSELRLIVAAGRAFGPENRAFGNVGAQYVQPIGDVTAGQQLLELYLDGGYTLDDRGVFRGFVAVSTAPTTGVGSAQFRAIAGLRMVPANLPSDEDGDGIDDRDDSCPKRAEDRDGFEDKDGCPDPDNDGDGILDGADKCPLLAEDHDGFEDADGCPEDDNDGDGILDKDDKCPNKAEDRDRFDDHDGCPEDDNDGDGILDKDDLCPNRPETVNGHEDQDGCPDEETAAPPSVSGARIVVSQPLRFLFGSAVLTPDAKKTLYAIGQLVRTNGKILALEVRVHTDDNGAPADLQMLSKQRAIAIRDYLDQLKALPTGKITAIGAGSSQPVVSNDTLRGRSQNRRVELLITATKTASKVAPKIAPK